MTFYELITEAVRDLSEHGFDSAERLDYWERRLREKAREALMPEQELLTLLRAQLHAVYARQVERGEVLRVHPGVTRFTLERVRPALRAELDRRILASAQLIKLNRTRAIETTLQRFSGWATSIPAGGSSAVDKVETKNNVYKALRSLPFEERRVAIDQGHKFTASLSATLALGSGAIAATWHSHWRQPGYNYRPDHKERDEETYAVRGCWAIERGLINKGAGYTDEMTQPAEEPFCRCDFQWHYNLRDLPAEMITGKGVDELARVRRMVG